MKSLVLLCVGVLLMCLTAPRVNAVEPGVKLRVSQSGANYAGQVAVDVMSASIPGTTIPNLSGTWSSWVGNVDYGITNSRVSGFTKPSTSVTVNGVLTWSMAGAGVTVTGNWNYSYRVRILFWTITIRDSGSFTASASGASVSASVSFGKTSDGRPTVASTDCSCNLGSVNLRFSGGASWLYNLFVGFFINPLKSNLQPKICQEARKAIDTSGSAQLSTMLVRIPFLNDWLFDYSLVANPVIGNGYLETSHKGEFFYLSESNIEAPYTPAPISTYSTSQMVGIWVSEYAINTMGYALYRRGILSYSTNISSSALLSSLYPLATVSVSLNASRAPTAIIRIYGIQGNFYGTASFSARFSNGTVLDLVTVSVNANVTVTPSFNGNFVAATASSSGVAVSIVSSNIGTVDDQLLSGLGDFLMATYVIPKLNEVGRRGAPVPALKNVAFPNAALQLQTGTLVLLTDVRY